jgi:hypothetical protein
VNVFVFVMWFRGVADSGLGDTRVGVMPRMDVSSLFQIKRLNTSADTSTGASPTGFVV